MLNNFSIKPLGSVLQRAGLVSPSQIELALRNQSQSNNMKIGEILALQGWIKQETADFFAERWTSLLRQKSKQPLGEYLKEAALLSDKQIKAILSQQKQKELGLRFGTLVVLNGWLKPTTIEFFLNFLYPERPSNLRANYSLHSWLGDNSSNPLEAIRQGLLRNQKCDSIRLLRLYQEILLQGGVVSDSSDEQAELLRLGLLVNYENKLKVASNIYQAVFNPCWVDDELICLDPYSRIKLQLLKLDQKASLPYRFLKELLSWTGSNPFLVQKLVQILDKSESFIPAGEEGASIEELVQTRIIKNWETQAAGDHLKEIRNGFVYNQRCEPLSLVKLYQKILQEGEVPAENSQEETELVKLGLIIEEEDKLKVANRIYQAVFNETWLEKEWTKMIRPSKLVTTPIVEDETVVEDETIVEDETFIQDNFILSTEGPIIKHLPDNQRNKTARWILVILILLGASLASLKLFTQSREEKIFQQGNELFIQGIYQEAIAKYNQVLKINANYYQAWTNRGYAFAGLGEYQKMLDSCTSATIIDAQAVYAWNCQGEALYNLKQYEDAIVAFDKAIALDPKNALFLINKAESLLALKESNQALEVVDKAIKLLNSGKEVKEEEKIRELSVAFTHQGKALWEKQEYERALQAYEQALKYVPDYFTAQRNRGIVLQKLNRSNEAVANFKQILNNPQLSNAQKAEIWYYLGLSLADLSQYQEAIAAFDKALKLKPDYQAPAEAKKMIVETKS